MLLLLVGLEVNDSLFSRWLSSLTLASRSSSDIAADISLRIREVWVGARVRVKVRFALKLEFL